MVGQCLEIAIVFIWVNGTVRAPFDNEATCLDERLIFRKCQRFNSGDGGVEDGEDLSSVAGQARAGSQRKKMVVALSVASWGQGNGAESARAERVGGLCVVEKLHVGPELKLKFVVVGRRVTGDNRLGTQGL